ncbi:FecR family protein [Mucilaginibacter gracilis]|uniref:FecR family protein n=1 Tax=Mucilaginibacter gracilis TaxID=423350 RepID=A0A495J8P6_9SPHI|nr:FecR family protein [Mucilaginibacter gracilis]RKR84419.1 FecR family protein [Mucilaginibacter gracilis]
MQEKNIHQSLHIAALIAKRLDDTLTAAEQNELSDWILEREGNRQLLEKITDLQSFERYKGEIERYDTTYALAQVKARIAVTGQPQQSRLWLPVSIAASVLFFFASFLLWNYTRPAQWITLTSPYGKMMRLQLPDSSLVWLNAGTTIQYPEAFNGHIRTVKLVNGQAYFDVRHHADAPFTVDAYGMKVSVLGTAFDIKSFSGEKEIRVTVSNGKVGVLPDKQPAVMLLPDEQAVLDRGTHLLVKRKVRSADLSGWRNGRLSFNEDDFTDVLNALQRKYNVAFRVERASLYHEKITLQLDDEPLATVLQALSFSNHFKYEQHEKLIVVR